MSAKDTARSEIASSDILIWHDLMLYIKFPA